MTEEDFQARIDLPPSTAAPEAARRLLEDLLHAWCQPQFEAMGEDARLVISELVTNAVQHAGDAGTLHMHVGGRRDGVLQLSLCDGSSDEPVRRESAPDAVGGRGLNILQHLTARWGVTIGKGHGKQVWAELR